MNSLEYTQKDTYFACLVHDLKTPLCTQQKIIELFLNNTFGEITPVQREVLTEFQKSAKYLISIVSDMLSSYLYENNQIRLNKELFDFSLFMEEIINELSVCLNGKQIFLEISPVYLFADKNQIKRTVINLISNAITYSSKNAVIKVKAKIFNGRFIFSINNKSSYLLPKDIKELFEKFRTKNPYGSGLGLYIVKQIVEAHSGNIFVERGKDNTCTFGFKIPVSS